jgi:Ca2+-transporting ATPase
VDVTETKEKQSENGQEKQSRDRMETMANTLLGLSQTEAEKRLEKFGENKLKEKAGMSWGKVLLDQFKSPLIYILLLASLTTLALGDVIDAGVIGAAVLLNTILGFYQEMKAERSLEVLARMLTPKAKVIRDGKRQLIEASQVVPGDICILEIGERVPADGVVVEGDSLSINEAILTGESAPVKKKKKSQLFMGTTISGGIGKMVVMKTGQATEVGKIAERLTETHEEKTPLQRQIGVFSKKLAWMVAGVSLLILAVGLAVGDPFVEIFATAVAVAVSAIPEGLAVSLTVILAIGMQRIFKRKALVRKLVAAETLGSVTVICADKTGTLTEGKMRVVRVLTDLNSKLELLTKAAILCNDMRDPLEIGMHSWALQQKLQGRQIAADEVAKQHPRLDEIPFDPKWRYIATLHRVESGKLLFVSGAPEEIISRSKMTRPAAADWLKRFEAEGRKGRRLVGFAYKAMPPRHGATVTREDVKDLIWLGALVYEDPVRSGVKKALKAAQQAGIQVKVITGDYLATAKAVLKKLELFNGTEAQGSEVMMEGYELEKLSDEQLAARIDEVVLFSRTNPEQKLRIVQALQNKGEVVAMTGDGVNDAPAVKKADIGIVVESASAVAKETADMVLLDSNFATIVGAVEEGRGIFVNLRKIILYLLSDAFAEVILVLGSMVFGLPLPITAAQILWVNLVDDGLPDFALTVEPKPDDLMRRSPRGLGGALLDTEIKLLIGLISTVTGLLSLGLFWWYWRQTGDLALARTMSFSLLAVSTLLYVFSCKSLKEPLWKEKIFDNKWLLLAVAVGGVFQLAAVYLPHLQKILKTVALGVAEWAVILGMSLLVIVMIEGVKYAFNHRASKG